MKQIPTMALTSQKMALKQLNASATVHRLQKLVCVMPDLLKVAPQSRP
jgi:hypothetical protein